MQYTPKSHVMTLIVCCQSLKKSAHCFHYLLSLGGFKVEYSLLIAIANAISMHVQNSLLNAASDQGLRCFLTECSIKI